MGLSGRKPGHMYVASYMLLINPVRAPRRPFLSKFKINRKNILFSRNISMLFSKIKKKKHGTVKSVTVTILISEICAFLRKPIFCIQASDIGRGMTGDVKRSSSWSLRDVLLEDAGGREKIRAGEDAPPKNYAE